MTKIPIIEIASSSTAVFSTSHKKPVLASSTKDIMKKTPNNKAYTLCLNMIVKNESHVIVKTLLNLCNYFDFDYWVISDTGSTDNTIELIEGFFTEKGIPGFIDRTEWVDFGHNRTRALTQAYNLTDYLLIFDADDKVNGDLVVPNILVSDAYQFKFGVGFVYLRTLMVNNRKRWIFKGVLHEYITCIDHEDSMTVVEGNYHLDSGRSGSRSMDPDKYTKDAAVLERGYHDEMTKVGGDRGLAERYAFYCAQSYMDAGPLYFDKSIEWYKKVLSQNNWYQEKFYSAYCIGNMYIKQGDTMNATKYWLKSIEYDPERIEGIASAMDVYRVEGWHVMVNALYHKFKNYKRYPRDKLFLPIDKYYDVIEYNNTVSAFYARDMKSGYEASKHIMGNRVMPDNYLESVLSNMVFYQDEFENDDLLSSIKLFFDIDLFMGTVSSNINRFTNEQFTVWNKLFNMLRNILSSDSSIVLKETAPQRVYTVSNNMILQNKVKEIRLNRHNPRVMITFTTCKRWDLFRETMNSILNQWTDIDAVDYWYCVDDNSNEDERRVMRETYPWIDFYMKTPKEKGHRESMNIIWRKLNETKPKYWIHMEDDFLFHTRGSYVNDAIRIIEDKTLIDSGENIKQILYNRNFGETINDYNIQGHRMIRQNGYELAVHVHIGGQTFPYGNCHYWPHYSFRPSIIDVETILSLGNYDSENQFFEMDYALKWMNAGYRSGFYNKITNRHIGRLTSERNLPNKLPNAYELNDESQFVARPDEIDKCVTAAVAVTAPIKVDLSTGEMVCKKYYVNEDRSDGFGAQFQNYIFTCYYVEENGNKFLYKPLNRMAHNYNNDPTYIERMENLMNLRSIYRDYREVVKEDSEVEIIVPNFNDIYNFTELNMDRFIKSKTMERIRDAFWKNKGDKTMYYPDKDTKIHVAIHVRRANLDDTAYNSSALPDSYYLKVMSIVSNLYLARENETGKKLHYHIFSQGKSADFVCYTKNEGDLEKEDRSDVTLHLNDSNEDTFIGMAAADVLVTSKSSFSYVAALFSDGDILHTEFWHKPCSWWTTLVP